MLAKSCTQASPTYVVISTCQICETEQEGKSSQQMVVPVWARLEWYSYDVACGQTKSRGGLNIRHIRELEVWCMVGDRMDPAALAGTRDWESQSAMGSWYLNLCQVLCQFVALLAEEGLMHSSIKVYLAAVRQFQVEAGKGDPSLGRMAKLGQVVQGVQRLRAEQGKRKREKDRGRNDGRNIGSVENEQDSHTRSDRCKNAVGSGHAGILWLYVVRGADIGGECGFSSR